MKTTIAAVAALAALASTAIANPKQLGQEIDVVPVVSEYDPQPWSRATPQHALDVEQPTCGRYEAIKTYQATTCAGKIFEDIETDAAGGGNN